VIVRLYRDMGGLIYGRENSVFWSAPEEIRSVAANHWLPPEANDPDAVRSYPVFSCGNGDAIGYIGPDRGFLYNHEIPALEPYDLVGYAKEYFGEE
jgi:hypothetical protein